MTEARGVKNIEPEDVAEAIVAALKVPKFDVYVPGYAGGIAKFMALLPRSAREGLSRALSRRPRADGLRPGQTRRVRAPRRPERAGTRARGRGRGGEGLSRAGRGGRRVGRSCGDLPGDLLDGGPVVAEAAAFASLSTETARASSAMHRGASSREIRRMPALPATSAAALDASPGPSATIAWGAVGDQSLDLDKGVGQALPAGSAAVGANPVRLRPPPRCRRASR